MALIKNKLSWIDGNAFFLMVLLANVAGLFFTKYYPTMDGPAHLYNSNVLSSLLMGDETLQQFYSINLMPIPNWLSHVILAISGVLLPAYLAEKVLLILYVAGMAISFRLLVVQFAPGNKSFSLLIFPFIYTFLFYLGFYNYSLSFIFFFLTVWIWNKHYTAGFTWEIKLLLTALITFTYLGNVLAYGFLGITLGCLICYDALRVYEQTNDEVLSLKKCWSELQLLLQMALPSLLFFAVFYLNAQFFSTDQRLPKEELIKWLMDNRSIIVYDYLKDEMYSKKIFWTMVLFVLCIAYRRIREYELSNEISFSKSDVILAPLALALAAFFLVPDGSGAGMMSIRYCILVSFLAVLWIATQQLPHFAKAFVLIVLFLSAGLFFNHTVVLQHLNKDAVALDEAADHIEAGSLVLPVNHSENWLEIHFSNYIGVDKPMVILENYEASVGWFPVRWNMDRMPRIVLDGKDQVGGVQWISNPASVAVKPIDYVMIYGNLGKINDASCTELKGVLDAGFTKVYSNEFVSLHKKKH